MAKQDQDPNNDLDTQGIPDLDAAPGPGGRVTERTYVSLKRNL